MPATSTDATLSAAGAGLAAGLLDLLEVGDRLCEAVDDLNHARILAGAPVSQALLDHAHHWRSACRQLLDLLTREIGAGGVH